MTKLPHNRSVRQLKAAEIIKTKLAEIFSRSDFKTRELYGKKFTISEVQITSDMRYATVYIWPLMKNDDEESMLKAFEKETPFLNQAIAKIMKSRNSPRITFKLETLFDDAEHVENLFRHPKVQQDIKNNDD